MDASEMASMMSGMSGMTGMGMDSSSGGMFLAHNQLLARTYWYIIAAMVGFACFLRSLRAIDISYRKRTARALSVSHPTRPRNFLTQAYATTVALSREVAYPQPFYLSHTWWEWLNPPPLGQCVVVVAYMAVILLFLTTGSIVDDAYYWERIGFRAAWVSVTQVPFVFLLGGKVNFISLFLGSSYVDVNWLHRWVSRILFVTVTVHGSFFLREWVRADFVQTELAMMPMVKYGLGLWGVLAWINITSLLPLRRICYEFFILQHIISAVIFLWLLSVHVPAYAMYNVWMAVAFLLLGRVIRGSIMTYRNITMKKGLAASNGKPCMVGYPMELQAMGGHTTVLTVDDVNFSWKAGQHVLLWCPLFAPLEVHPFTISNLSQRDRKGDSRKLELVVRARSGFTRRLNRHAVSSQAPIKAFITGPFGRMPTWNSFETLVLISASTGASFTLSILQSVLDEPCCVHRIDCLVLVRQRSHVDAYLPRLREILYHPGALECCLKITIAVTSDGDELHKGAEALSSLEGLSLNSHLSQVFTDEALEHTKPSSIRSTSGPQEIIPDTREMQLKGSNKQFAEFPTAQRYSSDVLEEFRSLRVLVGRPNIANIIRRPVEASAGETSVVVCGGKSLSSTVRNHVASLSDERAVHKGTGAQGIHLHVEGFGL